MVWHCLKEHGIVRRKHPTFRSSSGSEAQDKGDSRSSMPCRILMFMWSVKRLGCCGRPELMVQSMGSYQWAHTGPFVDQTILGSGSYNSKDGYPKKEVWYEPRCSLLMAAAISCLHSHPPQKTELHTATYQTMRKALPRVDRKSGLDRPLELPLGPLRFRAISGTPFKYTLWSVFLQSQKRRGSYI